MAQTHRTASLNRFSRITADDLHSHHHHQPHRSFRAATARHANNSNNITNNSKKIQTATSATTIFSQLDTFEPNDRLSTPVNTTIRRRPRTQSVRPISLHASEAHIHRIRSAASHADFKHQPQMISSMSHGITVNVTMIMMLLM